MFTYPLKRAHERERAHTQRHTSAHTRTNIKDTLRNTHTQTHVHPIHIYTNAGTYRWLLRIFEEDEDKAPGWTFKKTVWVDSWNLDWVKS